MDVFNQILFFSRFNFNVCVSECMCHVVVPVEARGARVPELEFQEVLSHLLWGLGAKLRFFEITECIPHH